MCDGRMVVGRVTKKKDIIEGEAGKNPPHCTSVIEDRRRLSDQEKTLSRFLSRVNSLKENYLRSGGRE